MVTFLVEEGTRYKIDKISFKGNTTVSEKDLREGLKLVEGRPYDLDVLRRDLRDWSAMSGKSALISYSAMGRRRVLLVEQLRYSPAPP